MRFLRRCDQNWVRIANAFVQAHRRQEHEARIVTFCENVNHYDEDICLHLPFLKGTPFHMLLKRVMAMAHGNRSKVERPPGELPVCRPRSGFEERCIRWREALWRPRIERAIRDHGLADYDVYHLESGTGFTRDARFLKEMKARGKRIVCYYLGTDLRNRGVLPDIHEISDLNLTCEWDHLALDPSLEYFFLPFDASLYEYREPATDKLRICHAPRNRWFKGTEQVIEAVRRARRHVDLEFELIEGVTHAEAIRRKRTSNLLIDHIGEAEGTTGYGVNSLEGLAMGIPCLSSMMDAYEKFIGPHRFLTASAEGLEAKLIELGRNPGALKERSRRGREWVERVHGPDAIVEKIYARYRDLGWMDGAGRAIPAEGSSEAMSK